MKKYFYWVRYNYCTDRASPGIQSWNTICMDKEITTHEDLVELERRISVESVFIRDFKLLRVEQEAKSDEPRCVRCGLSGDLLDLDTGSVCHRELIHCIQALKKEVCCLKDLACKK